MPLSWNEIRHRAIAFSREWQGETREAAERQSFWNDFSNIFGVRRPYFRFQLFAFRLSLLRQSHSSTNASGAIPAPHGLSHWCCCSSCQRPQRSWPTNMVISGTRQMAIRPR
jgi:hypothetical protein